MNPETPVNPTPDIVMPDPVASVPSSTPDPVAEPLPTPTPAVLADAPSPGAGMNLAGPEAPHGWNWGAFFFGWFWGVFNKVWISLLSFVPVVGIFMPIILGIKGTEWAWKAAAGSKTVDEFKTTQHRWAVAGFVLFGVSLMLVVGVSLLQLHLQSTARTGAQTTAQNFMADVQKDDATDAYQLTSTTFQASTSSADFKTAVDKLAPNLTGSFNLTVLEAIHTDNRDGHTAVSYRLIEGQHEVVLKLSQAPHGKWLIDVWYPNLTPAVPSS